jgi:hypothetical protein
MTDVNAILAFPVPRDQIVPATEFRATWVVSSLQTLRTRGHYDRYVTLLPTAYHSVVLEAVAGTWLPMGAARAHYVACNDLALPLQEEMTIGGAVGDRAQGSILSLAVRAAKGAGVTPWTIFPQFDRLWRRGANGGAAAVFRLGPKEARNDVVGCELFDIPYFEHAFRGVLMGIVELFCEKVYVHPLPRRRSEASFHFQWA